MELTNIIVRPNQLPREVRAAHQDMEESLNELRKMIESIHELNPHRIVLFERLKTRSDRYRGLCAKLENGLRFKPTEDVVAAAASELWDHFDRAFERIDRIIEAEYEGN